jgi:hypothetical protein
MLLASLYVLQGGRCSRGNGLVADIDPFIARPIPII